MILDNLTPTEVQKCLEAVSKVGSATTQNWSSQKWQKFFRLRLKAALLRPEEEKDQTWVVWYIQKTCQQLKEHMTARHGEAISVEDVLADEKQEERSGCKESVLTMALKMYDKDALEDRSVLKNGISLSGAASAIGNNPNRLFEEWHQISYLSHSFASSHALHRPERQKAFRLIAMMPRQSHSLTWMSDMRWESEMVHLLNHSVPDPSYSPFWTFSAPAMITIVVSVYAWGQRRQPSLLSNK